MNQKLGIGLSVCAGTLGGMLSHFVVPNSASGQVLRSAPKQITAESFVLVDLNGRVSGTFGFDKAANPSITLLDKSGNVVWKQNGKVNTQPLAENH